MIKFFFRYVLPLILVVFGVWELFGLGRFLMNLSDDLAVLAGVLCIALAIMGAIGFVAAILTPRHKNNVVKFPTGEPVDH